MQEAGRSGRDRQGEIGRSGGSWLLASCTQVPNKNPLFMMEEEQKEHVAKLNKMEREMEEVFERKVGIISMTTMTIAVVLQVREKKQKLSDNEQDLQRRQGESTSR